jgi:hypothetical protein
MAYAPGFELHRMADASGNLAGVEMVGDPPEKVSCSQNLVMKGMAEGWIHEEGHEVITRPAGPPGAPWRPTPTAPTPHVFHHFTYLTVCGVRYQVVRNPDKFKKGSHKAKVTEEVYDSGDTEVDWTYDLKKVEDG